MAAEARSGAKVVERAELAGDVLAAAVDEAQPGAGVDATDASHRLNLDSP